jgi:hypothetical protein
MQIFIFKAGNRSGPFSLAELNGLVASGGLLSTDHAWYQGCPDWIRVGEIPGVTPPMPVPPPYPVLAREAAESSDTLIRRISDYARISGILWIVLGSIQVLSIVGAIAGAWNIFAGITRLQAATRISNRDPKVPGEFNGITGLVSIGIINLLLGGVIGLLFVAFDFVIRDKILSNPGLFAATPLTAQDSTGGHGP